MDNKSNSRPLHVGAPNFGDMARFTERVAAIYDNRWLTNDGPFVREFEERIATIAGVKHCVAMCNATVALEILIRAAGIAGEVIVPAYTFVATAHALQWQQITPVFCDIEPDNHTINPSEIERLITPRTTAIIGVHIWGKSCNVAALKAIADRRNLLLMFDAAHAFGCSHGGRPIGGNGLAEVFSFHATKFLNAAEGGAVVTNDDELASKMRLMRNFGFSGYDNVIYIGTNGKMNELSAAMGLTSLESMERFLAVNKRNYAAYQTVLTGLPGISLIDYDNSEQQNYQYVVLDVSPSCPLSRDQLVQVLHGENVLARRYFFPGVHKMEPYRSFYPNAGLLLPVTERVVEQVLVLPTGTTVSEEDISRIGQILGWAVSNSDRLCQELPKTIPPGCSMQLKEHAIDA